MRRVSGCHRGKNSVRFKALLALFALYPVLASASAWSDDWSNPLVLQRADPHVTRVDGRYLMIATVPEYDRIELRGSASLDGLRNSAPMTIWRKHESGPMSAHIWAPEIHRVDGKWYVYFAAGRADDVWAIRMYVLENASPDPFAGTWVEKGQIKTRWETFSLDATTFEHRGQRYLSWAQKDPGIEGNTNIYLAKMDTPWSITGQPAMLSKPDLEWERIKYKVNEGPAVLIRNGRLFMTYSASATDQNYCMGLLTAGADADLLDPRSWTKSKQPVFATWSVASQYGPGHNSFTTATDGRDVMVYHARNYREIVGNELRNPDRHTRAQYVEWRPDGTPDFGVPVPDGPLPSKMAPKPLFRDPIFDGAADPVVIWNPERRAWWMFYTNRRASAPGLSGVAWVHGTRIGIAESKDGGTTWAYVGVADVALPADVAGDAPTHWAPDVFTSPDGVHHMFLTVVPGIFENWQHPRHIVHLTSRDLRTWGEARTLKLASDRVIDASVFHLPDGTWRLFYNNERDRKSIYVADSPDLRAWTDRGKVVGDQGGEGPKVFKWRGAYWMITDVWQGLAVYRSDDALSWTRQSGGNLLASPGRGVDDGVQGQHPDIVISGDRVFLFYFTHPGRTDPKDKTDGYEKRRSSLHVVELTEKDGRLSADRDAPTYVRLIPSSSPSN
jgi:GH43 family beta-xylosidase